MTTSINSAAKRKGKNLTRSKKTALLLIDVINDFDFPDGRKLLRFAMPAGRRIASLRKRAAEAHVPVIYVNDNFGQWRSDFREQIRHCREDGSLGRGFAELLAPGSDDYFVLKPKHSGFFATSLEILLHHLRVRRLILTGFATDICVLYTANDGYMRGLEICMPRDCVAAETAMANTAALLQMERCLKADVKSSRRVEF